MRPKSIMLLVLALGCGLVAAIGIRQIVVKNAKAAPEGDMTRIFVAITELKWGDKLVIAGDGKNVKLESWPTEMVERLEGPLTHIDDIEDCQAGARIMPGMPLLESLLLGAGNMNGMSAAIPPGFRAYTIKGTSDTVLGDNLRPEHRVDVLLYVEKKKLEGQGFPGIPTQTMMLLANIRVLAINDQTNREQFEDAETSVSIKSVTLLLEEKQAVRLAFAGELGKLRLIMRGVGEDPVDSMSDHDPSMGTIDKFGDTFLQIASREKGPSADKIVGPLSDLKQPTDTVVAEPTGPPPFQVTILEGAVAKVYEMNPKTRLFHLVGSTAGSDATTTSAAQANGTPAASAGSPQGGVDLTGLAEEDGDQ